MYSSTLYKPVLTRFLFPLKQGSANSGTCISAGNLISYVILFRITMYIFDLLFFRIRGISIVKVGEPEDNNFYLFTASSDGFIKMFSVLIEEDEVVVFIQWVQICFYHLSMDFWYLKWMWCCIPGKGKAINGSQYRFPTNLYSCSTNPSQKLPKGSKGHKFRGQSEGGEWFRQWQTVRWRSWWWGRWRKWERDNQESSKKAKQEDKRQSCQKIRESAKAEK